MEEKKDLNEILLGDENKHQSSKAKKVLLMLLVAIIVIAILLIVYYKFSREGVSENNTANQDSLSSMEKLNQIQPVANSHEDESNSSSTQTNAKADDDFNDMSIDDTSKTNSDEDLKFDKIVQDIKSKQLGNSTESTTTQSPDSQTQESSKTDSAVSTPENTADKEEKPVMKQSETIKSVDTAPTKPTSSKVVTKSTSQPATKEVKKVVQKPAVSKNIEKKSPVATSGIYLQVGAFSKKPNKEFIQNISKYKYRTQTLKLNGESVTKYLIGPYKNRAEAENHIMQVSQDFGKPMVTEIK